jgi:hypothetical protein
MKYLLVASASLAALNLGLNLGLSPVFAQEESAIPEIAASSIEAHIRFLASDALAGRDAGSEGYEIAANYVAAQMQQLGLEPMGENGTYMADVPLHDVMADASYNRLTLDGVEFDHGDHVYVSLNPTQLETEVTGELVFVGHGVSAPTHGHDDYADIDVSGKIVVVLGGLPDGLPSEERAHHGSSTRANAAAHGAVGIIFLTEWTPEDVREFSTGFAARPTTRLTSASGPSPYDQIVASANVDAELGAQLFEGAEMNLEEVRKAMDSEDGASYPRFALPHTVTIRQRTISEPFSDPNVVGMIRGSDPDLADEVVLLSAHLDHIGIVDEDMRSGGACRSEDEEDLVCNGAIDNASGVSIMIETAREFVANGAPRRSVLFVALAAEEKGLLGSSHIARNPVVPDDSIVANVNLDMPIIVYEFSDVMAFGGEHSTLGPIASRAATRMNLEISPDPIPEQNIFVRSDHYSFVQAGIPSIMLATGFSSPDPRWDQGEGFMGFINTHYHRQTDQLDGELEVLFEQGAKFANINYMIAREITDSDERPEWNDDSFFGNLFGREN